MRITVEADEGVFPEGSTLSVEKVTLVHEKQAEEAVESERDEDKQVAASYTYDIKVLDKDGNELQPAEESGEGNSSRVKVSFKLDEVADENLTTNVYHITENEGETAEKPEDAGNGALTAEKLEVETDGDTAIAETDGFSLYTVEFTYDNKQYVLPGDSEVALSEVLDTVGLTGEVSDVEVSDESLFSAKKCKTADGNTPEKDEDGNPIEDENGTWFVFAHQAFSTTEWMKVTIGGVVYEITVTDDASYSATFGCNEKSYSTGSITGTKEIQLSTILTALEITGDVTAASVSEGQGMTVTTTAITLTKAFGTGWLRVTAGGTEYEITITSTPDSISVVLYGTLFFDKNGGSGIMDGQSVREYSTTVLPDCTFTPPDGYEFDQWEINGARYNAGATFTFGQTTTAKAIWKLREGVHSITAAYKISDGDVVVSPTMAAADETVTVTVQPVADKAVDSITYSYGSTAAQALSGGDGGVYTFSMPGEDTTVSVTFKDATKEPIAYVDENGSSQNCNDYRYVRSTDTIWSGWVVASQNLTLDRRVTVSGTVNLILMDGKTLTVTGGIQVGEGSTLNIYAQSGNTGVLIAGNKQNSYAAGIGGNKGSYNAGTITVNGGQITATGGYSSAGIGGASEYYPYLGSAGNITIRGKANVVATGGEYSSGIGCGSGGIGGSITIDGNARVQARALEGYSGSGAAIGSGRGGYVNSITISGGTVIATGANMGSAIGNGNSNSGGDGGTISITGGDVTATATGSWGAGIGGLCKSITIGGNAVVHATGGNRGAGIGGYYQKAVGNITVEGNANVTATGGASGAGIGTGSEAEGETVITITGGTVNASMSASNGAAAIGSGNKSKGKTTVSISGGQVTASGSSIYGVGIGGGNTGAAEEEVVVNITGGTVNANGRAGIGTANASNAKLTINISGGKVTARGAIDGSNKCAAIGQGNNSNSVTEINITGGIVRALGTGTGIGSGANSKQTPTIKLGYTDETKNGMEITAIDYNGTVTLNKSFKYQDGTGAVSTLITANKTIVPSDSTAHTHGFTYTVDGKTITATCTNSDNQCNLTEHKATLTIGEPDGKTSMVYDGTAKAAVLTGDTDVLTADVVYKKGNTVLPSAPSDAGNYTASITLGEATATVSYEITKKSVTFASITAKDKVYDGTTKASCTIGTGLNGAVSGDNVYANVNTGNATFEDANAGVNKKVTFSGREIAGTAKGNYELIQPEPQYRAITPRVITITAKAQTVSQGGTVVSTPEQVEVTGGTLAEGQRISEITLTGDTSALTTSGTVTPSAVKILDASNNDVTANYAVNYTAGTLTVTDAPAHIHGFAYSATGATITATCSDTSCALHSSPATLTLSATDATYTGSAYAGASLSDTTAWTAAGLTVPTIEYEGRGDTHYTKNATAPTDMGTYTARITVDTDKTATANFTISPMALTINTATATNRPYDKDSTAVTISAVTFKDSSERTVSLMLGEDNDYTVTGAMTDANAGDGKTVNVTVTLKNANYSLATNTTTTTVNINKADARTIADVTDSQLYTATSISKSVADKMPDDAGTLTYTAGTASKTGSVTISGFAVDTEGNVSATLSGGAAGDTVTMPVTIGSINYADSTVNVKITLTEKDDAVVSISGAPTSAKTYGDADFTLTGSVTNEGTGTGTWTWSTSDTTVFQITPNGANATVKILKAGSATITAKYESNTTVDTETTAAITVNTKTLTIAAKNQSIFVGGTVPDLGTPVLDTHYTVTGLVGSDVLTTPPTLKYQKNKADATPDNNTAGTYDIVPSGASAGANYNISYANGTLTITAKDTQTITAENVTATYGDTDKSVSATTDGNGTISYALKDGSGNYIDVNANTGALTIKKAGTATVIVTAAETANYAQATKEVTVTIAKASFQPKLVIENKTYDGNEITYTITDNPGRGAVTSISWEKQNSDDSWSSIDDTPKDAGKYRGTATIAETDNYNGATTNTVEFTISKAAVRTLEDVTVSQVYTLTGVSVSVAGKMPDDAGPLTYAEGAARKTGSVTVSDWDVDSFGNVTATLSGGAAGDTVTLPVIIGSTNYADSTVNVVVTLREKDDAGVSTSTPPPTPLQYLDTLTLTGSVQNPGTNGTWIWTSSDSEVFRITPDGANATIEMMKAGTATITASYESDTTKGSATVELTVDPKPVTITGLSVSDKEYDGNTSATVTGTAAINGKIGNDDVTVTAGTAAFEDKNVGTGKTVTFNGYSLSGTAAGNYALSEQPASVTANITPKEVTVSGITANDKTYDGTTVATLDYTNAAFGKCGSDDLTVSATGTFADANVGDGKTVNISNLTLGGTDAGNYVLAESGQQTSTTASITKATATLSVGTTSYTKTFGDAAFNLEGITTTPATASLTYTVSDSKNASNATVDNNKVITVNESGTVTIVGAGSATITISLPESTNYNAAESKTVTITVNKKTADAVSAIEKTYLYTAGGSESITLSSLLPTDCGSVDYEVSKSGDVSYSQEPGVSDGVLSYTVSSGTVNTTGTITITAKTDNYVDIPITVNVKLADQKPITLRSGSEVKLNSSSLTYGEALSTLTFKNGTVFTEQGNESNEISGTIAWKNPSEKPAVGTTSAAWVFTPSNTTYASLEGTVSITVNKATPEITTIPTATAITYGQTLGDSALSGGEASSSGLIVAGGFAWSDTTISPEVSDSNNTEYTVKFTPTDSGNYNESTCKVKLTVNKATITESDITVPTAKTGLTYTGSAQALITAGSCEYGEMQYALGTATEATQPYTTSIPSKTNAGTYYVWYKVNGDANHKDGEAACLKVEITKADITPTVSIEGWTYGDTAKTPSVMGNTGNGEVTYTYAVKGSTEFNKAVPTAAGEYTVKAGIATTDHYKTAEAVADFAIKKKAVVVTPDADQNKVYGAADPAFTYTATGLVGEEELSGALARAAGEAAGEYAYTIGTLDSENANYSVSLAESAPKFEIKKAALTVTADPKNITYGDEDAALTYKVEGLTGSDKAEDVLTGTLAREAGRDAGTYKITQGSLTSADYGITFTGADYVIAKASQAAPAETFTTAKATESDTADGRISGFAAAKAYQISSDNGTTWTDVTGKVELDVKAGTYQIRYAEDQNHEAGASTAVTVGAASRTAVTGVSVEPASVKLTEAGETKQIEATVAPEDADNKKVTWKSSDETVATVDENGLITAVANGTADITVTTDDGSKTATVQVTVEIPEPATEAPATEAPATETPATEAPATEAPATEAPATEAPATEAPATEVPATEVTKTEAPTTEASATEAPKTEAPTTEAPKETTEEETAELALNAGLKISQTGSKITVKWGRVKEADGYQVYAAYCGRKFGKPVATVKGNSKTKVTISKINGKKINLKKNFKVYVTAYKLKDSSETDIAKTITGHVVGRKNTKYSNAKKITLKQSKYTVAAGKTAAIKAKTVLVDAGKKQLSDAHATEFRYASSNEKIATVDKKGKIKGVSAGTCTVYVYARNGYAKKIQVTVK